MEPDLSQCLVARKGEVIACPECGAAFLVLLEDAYGPIDEWWSFEKGNGYDQNRWNCARCGGAVGQGPQDATLVDLLRAPRLHFSTGWRDLGGE